MCVIKKKKKKEERRGANGGASSGVAREAEAIGAAPATILSVPEAIVAIRVTAAGIWGCVRQGHKEEDGRWKIARRAGHARATKKPTQLSQEIEESRKRVGQPKWSRNGSLSEKQRNNHLERADERKATIAAGRREGEKSRQGQETKGKTINRH